MDDQTRRALRIDRPGRRQRLVELAESRLRRRDAHETRVAAGPDYPLLIIPDRLDAPDRLLQDRPGRLAIAGLDLIDDGEQGFKSGPLGVVAMEQVGVTGHPQRTGEVPRHRLQIDERPRAEVPDMALLRRRVEVASHPERLANAVVVPQLDLQLHQAR